MILIAAIATLGIGLFILVVAVIAAVLCASLGDPLFAETPGDEFADDVLVDADAAQRLDAFLDDRRDRRTCARPHCDLPVWRECLCEGHHDLMVDMAYELRREIEDYERTGGIR